MACPSTLRTAEKEALKLLMTTIGKQVSRDWSVECTHLCMNSVTVTEKVNLLCLLNLLYLSNLIFILFHYIIIILSKQNYSN